VRIERRRIAGLAAAGVLCAAPAAWTDARVVNLDPARRLALFVGNAETESSLRQLAGALVQSFGYAAPVELYGPAATPDAIRQSLARIAEEASPADTVTVVIGLTSVRLSAKDPFGQFLVPAGGNPEQPWTLMPVGELQKFLMGSGRASATLLVIPECPGLVPGPSDVCSFASPDRTLTTLSVCAGGRGEDHLVARFVSDGARILTSFAAEAGANVRTATVRELMAASKEGYQAALRQCPAWADPFTFVVAPTRLSATLLALDPARPPDERVGAVERLVSVVSTEPRDRAAASATLAIGRLADVLFDTTEPAALRSRAAWGLGELKAVPQPVLDRMVDLIGSDTETGYLRASAVAALTNIGSPAGASALRASLGRPGVTAVGPEVVIALGHLRDLPSLPLLIDMAGTGDERMRRAALAVLPSFGADALRPHATDLESALVAAMRHPTADIRRAGAALAASIDTFGTITTIFEILARDPDPRVREAAAYAVGRSLERKELGALDRRTALARLLEASERDPHEVRAAALWSLGHAGGARAEARLLDVVRNTKEHIGARSAAAEALGLMRSERSVPVLAQIVLRPEDTRLRGSAAVSLGAIGTPAAADALLKVVADEKGTPAAVRTAAQAAMERIRPAGAPLAGLDDKSPLVRLETVRRIGETRDPQHAAKLIERLGDPDAEVRAAALSALAPLAGDASVVATVAKTVDSDSDALRRVGAARVLGASAAPVARAALVEAVDEDRAPAVRAAAVEALGRQAAAGGATRLPDDVARALRKGIADTNAAVRLSTARALGALADPDSEELLKKMTLDASPDVREAAFDGLALRTRQKK
jgi:HEAT repeat protein